MVYLYCFFRVKRSFYSKLQKNLTLSLRGAYLVGHEKPSLFSRGLLSRPYIFCVVVMTVSTAANDFITKKKPFEFFFQKQKSVCEYLYQFRHNFILKINKKNGENALWCLLFVILLSSSFVSFVGIYFSNI